eukprot:g4610.t1
MINTSTFSIDAPAANPLENTVPNSINAAAVSGVEKRLTSRYRGVCWNRKNRRWQTAINRGGKYIYLGSFVSEIEAAKAFDRAAVKLRGHSTKINFDFENYKEELRWHEHAHRVDGAAEAILADPKILREKNEKQMYPTTNHPTASIAQNQGTPVETGGGMPCSGNTNQRLTMPIPFLGYLPQSPVQSPQMMGVTGTGFLSQLTPSSTALHPSMVPTSQSMRPSLVSQLPTKPNSRTQFFPGMGNAFALAYSKANTNGISVLVFDGSVMSENGVFSTMEDASQACKSLLSILEKMQTHRGKTRGSTPGLQPPSPPPPPNSSSNEANTEVLQDRSPFDIGAGIQPGFLQEMNDQTWIPHEGEKQGNQREDGKGPFPGTGATSIQERMGSLLSDSNQQFPNREKTTQSVEKPQETNAKFTSNMSFLSRSLEDLVSMLNQSGQMPSLNCESIKREREDDEQCFLAPPSIDLHLEEKSFRLNTHPLMFAFQNGPEVEVVQDGYAMQSNRPEMHDGNDVMKKRKSDNVQDSGLSKKAREGLL